MGIISNRPITCHLDFLSLLVLNLVHTSINMVKTYEKNVLCMINRDKTT